MNAAKTAKTNRWAGLVVLAILTVLSAGACLPLLLSELNSDEE